MQGIKHDWIPNKTNRLGKDYALFWLPDLKAKVHSKTKELWWPEDLAFLHDVFPPVPLYIHYQYRFYTLNYHDFI